MAIAYSGQRIVYGTFDATRPANFLAGLDPLLRTAGWTASVIAGGFEYRLVSPQAVPCRFRLWTVGGDVTDAHARFLSDDGVRLGDDLLVRCGEGAATTVQAIVGKSQVFVSRPGTDLGSFCGGIPWMPTPVEAWWYCSNDSFFHTDGIRKQFYVKGQGIIAGACYDGSLVSTYQDRASLRLMTATGTQRNGWKAAALDIVRVSGTPLYLDPLIGWTLAEAPDAGGGPDRIVGQLWDSVYVTTERPLDDIITADLPAPDGRAMPWMNFTNFQHFALYLLRTYTVPGGGPVSYVY